MNSILRFVLAFSCLLQHVVVQATECVDAPTSEGPRTLPFGGKACAALQAGETNADKGKRFIMCKNGVVLTENCVVGLRFDVKVGGCTWPTRASCALPGESTPAPAGNDNDVGITAGTGGWTPASTVPLPSGDCGPSTCSLPSCFCYGSDFTALPRPDIPQFVMLTFDDGVTAALYEQFYRPLFIDNTYNLLNPNGCRIKTTMYAIHENTDYSMVKSLANAGNEIASHTVHHILAQGDKASDYANISAEITGMREEILRNTGDKALADSVVGFRAPYLRVAGDVMFEVLRDNTFLYDTSIVNLEASLGRPPLWPFTLEFPVKSCVNPPCPSQSYPGLWEVPLNGWVGDDGFSCGMIDGCSVGGNVFTATEQDWYNYYQRNFRDHFNKSKVPMHIFTHASMFLRSPGSFQALVRWLNDTLTAHHDVWLVSPKQVIEWMQSPIKTSQMATQKWGCN